MTTLNYISSNKTSAISKSYEIVLFLLIFIFYVILRAYAWSNTVLLEDTDSIFYLYNIKAYLSLDSKIINALNPDSTPFYPVFAAVCSLPGWSLETGARICSFLFSCLLFLSLLKISKQITEVLPVFIALVLLTLNPYFVSNSFAVLTEPSYIATIYFGFWLFLRQYENLSLSNAAILGIIFALSFLNRTEGLLFLAVIPFLKIIHLLNKQNKFKSKRLIIWNLVFITFYCLLAVPQIWHVSNKMGTFAINGRQAWRLLHNNLKKENSLETTFGLDFSPKQINIYYARMKYAEFRKFSSKLDSDKSYNLRAIIRNINKFYRKLLVKLFYPLDLVFIGFGLFTLYTKRRLHHLFIVLSFIVFNTIAPLTHTSFLPRHFFLIMPAIFLLEAVGIAFIFETLLSHQQKKTIPKIILSFMLFLLIVAQSYPQLRHSLKPKNYNAEYSLVELERPIRIVKTMASERLNRGITIAGQRAYLSYYTGSKHFFLPFTDYNGLVKYCFLNNVDVIYLKHSRLDKYPWFKVFLQKPEPSDFCLIYRGLDAAGEVIELYRFNGGIANDLSGS